MENTSVIKLVNKTYITEDDFERFCEIAKEMVANKIDGTDFVAIPLPYTMKKSSTHIYYVGAAENWLAHAAGYKRAIAEHVVTKKEFNHIFNMNVA